MFLSQRKAELGDHLPAPGLQDQSGQSPFYNDGDDAAAHGDGGDGVDEHLPALGLQDQSGQSPL